MFLLLKIVVSNTYVHVTPGISVMHLGPSAASLSAECVTPPTYKFVADSLLIQAPADELWAAELWQLRTLQ
jgi:hypothetical protein